VFSGCLSHRLLLAGLAVIASLCAALPDARAAAGSWLEHGEARLRLIAAQDSVGASGTLDLGLQFELRPGWKIYWRSPGDAGFPPVLDWSGSRNLDSSEMAWPVPHRFSLFGLETFGYEDEVVFPIAVRAAEAGAPVALEAEIHYLVCEEICIPYSGTLGLDLPAGSGARGRDGLLIDQYRLRVPGRDGSSGLAIVSAILAGAVEAQRLLVAATSETGFEAPDLIVEGPPGFAYGRPEARLANAGHRVAFEIPVETGPQAEGVLEGKRLVLTLYDGGRGLETETVARYAAAGAGALPLDAAGLRALLVILGIALLGGLILNLMPCVLPVLSIKLLSVVSAGGRDRAAVRASFLATSAGILVSFLLLAAGAIGLKSAGLAAGWGIQFQQPLFLVAMALVVTLFALNLFGLFEVLLPGRVAGVIGAERLPDATPHGHAGSFATGLFATLLATPCSAPFVGTAIGFALARGAGEIVLIFLALGLGLALPYLLVAALPGLAARLPRPGHWMVTLRRILGLLLLATAVWLLTVLDAQVGTSATLLTAALLIALALVLAWRSLGRRSLAALAGAGALALAVLAAPLALGQRQPLPAAGATADLWPPLDLERIDRAVGEGRVVFVDVTADWCLTCQVNKKLVIESDAVAGRLDDADVLKMRGDWTQPDPAITAYLESFGRYGIPFNAVYGPALPDGEALGELLSVDEVLEALTRARGG